MILRAEYITRVWFRVRLHDTTAHLQRAAKRQAPGESWDGVGGCIHPAKTWIRRADTGLLERIRRPDGYGGLVRLSRQQLTTRTVAHEVMHAALVAYRQDRNWTPTFGPGCDEREERLCYIVGEYQRAMTNLLHDCGAWS